MSRPHHHYAPIGDPPLHFDPPCTKDCPDYVTSRWPTTFWWYAIEHFEAELPPGPGGAPEHWTWDLFDPDGEVALSGFDAEDPEPMLGRVVTALNAMGRPRQSGDIRMGDRVGDDDPDAGTVIGVVVAWDSLGGAPQSHLRDETEALTVLPADVQPVPGEPKP